MPQYAFEAGRIVTAQRHNSALVTLTAIRAGFHHGKTLFGCSALVFFRLIASSCVVDDDKLNRTPDGATSHFQICRFTGSKHSGR